MNNDILSQDSFNILGINHHFDEEFLFYNAICRIFVSNAYEQKKVFRQEYNAKVKSFDDLFPVAFNLLLEKFMLSSGVATCLIKQMRNIDITPQKFYEVSCSEGSIDLDKYLMPLYKAKEAVDEMVSEVEDYRKIERELQKQNRSKSNLFSQHGAAGWLFDGMIDLAADAVRGAGHMYTDSQDKKKIAAVKQEVFKNTPINGYPNMSSYLKNIVEPMCFEVFSGVRPIIGLEPVFYPEDIQNSLDIIKKADSYRPITAFEVVDAIFRQPYEIKLYNILLQLNEEAYPELLIFAEFTGLKEKFLDSTADNVREWTQKAYNSQKSGDNKTAVKYYNLSVEAGDTRAMLGLGSIYANGGNGVTKNEIESQKWYEKAANAGITEAMFYLGMLLLNQSAATSNKKYTESFNWFKKAADKGDANSMKMIAEFYRTGRGIPEDTQQALYWYEKAANAGNQEAKNELENYKDELLQIEEDKLDGESLFKRAEKAFANKNYKVALRCYEKAEKQNNLNAIVTLAEFYEKGIHVQRNFDKAFKLYVRAANAHEQSAMLKVAGFYDRGQNIKKDSKAAVDWYKKLVKLGNIDAIMIMANKYNNGDGVKKDKTTALEFYLKAADLGNFDAMVKIAQNYESKSPVDIQSLKNALTWYEKADELNPKFRGKIQELKQKQNELIKSQAEEKLKKLSAMKKDIAKTDDDKPVKNVPINSESTQDTKADTEDTPTEVQHADELYKLGLQYYNGKERPKDFEKAFKCFEDAANAGNNDATYSLGLMYAGGDGRERNRVTAIEYFKKAANGGNVDAMYALGEYYYNGRKDIKKDVKQAFYWLLKAAKAGHSISMNWVGFMYDNGEGTDKNPSQATEWYNRAADLGNTTAMGNIAYNYARGIGVEKDLNVALKWYKKMLDFGDNIAVARIAEMYDRNGDIEQALQWYDKAMNEYKIPVSPNIIKRLKQNQQQQQQQNDNGCFITTAVCGSFNKPDDCYELTAFRNFRDNWLINQSDGKTLIEEYYQIAPSIVSKIDNLPSATQIYKKIWEKYLSPCLNLIENGDNQSCKRLYIEMVNSLKKKFL